MTAKNRAGLIAKLHTSLKKHYKPAPAAPGRPLLEHILYAALLEDAPVDLADEGFAKCEQEFFDWNEVRVTSVTELAEVLTRFPSPPTTAARLKRCLQNVFEGFYNFDIDHLKKENLGKAVAKFEAMSGISPFVLAYLIQHGLGGHAIPVNTGAMQIMLKTGIVSDSEAGTGKVPGLERAIAKSKAIEFSSMLHQAAVALQADPLDKTVWEVILSVNKDAQVSPPKPVKQKSVKRPVAPPDAAASPAVAGKTSPADSKAKSKAKPKAGSKASGSKAAAETAPAAAAKTAKPVSGKSKAAGTAATNSAAPAEQRSTKSASPAAPAASKASSPESPAATKKGASNAAKKSATSKKNSTAAKTTAGKRSSKTADAGTPAANDSPTSDLDKAEDAPVAGGNGNQKLTKQKPR